MFANPAAALRPVLVNGGAGVVVTVAGRPVSIMGFTISNGLVVAIDTLADPGRIGRLGLADSADLTD